MACPEKHEWFGMTQTQMRPHGASLVAQMVKNLPAMQETQVQSLGWEDPLKKDGNPLQYSCLENPMDGGAWWAAIYGVAQSRTLRLVGCKEWFRSSGSLQSHQDGH